MRRLLASGVLLGLLVGSAFLPPARAQEVAAPPPASAQAGHGGGEPPLLPAPRPALVQGELRTPRFRLLYTARAEGAARGLAERIERVRDTFQSLLGRDWPGITEVRLGAGRKEMEALALSGGQPPGWARALAYPAHNIILLDSTTLDGPDGTDTLWHELSHVALGRLGTGWPRWFQEGLAVQLTGERFDVSRYTALFRAVRQDRVMAFEDLARAWPEMPWDVEVAYAQSGAFVGWLLERHGTPGMAALLDGVRAGEPFEMAFGKAFHTSLSLEEQAWRAELPSRYGWLPWVTTSSLAMALAAGLSVLAFLRRRRQKALRLLAMEMEEAAEEAARRLLEAEAQAEAARSRAASGWPPEWGPAPAPAEPPAPDTAEPDAEAPDAPGDARPAKPTLH